MNVEGHKLVWVPHFVLQRMNMLSNDGSTEAAKPKSLVILGKAEAKMQAEPLSLDLVCGICCVSILRWC
jgi:hypothetical protein